MALLSLFGSGEFLPWARDIDRRCADLATSSSDRALIVPTACAPEGDDVFEHWASLGIEHYEAIGLTPEVLPLCVREDAFDPAIVERVAGARMIFFSGGNPGYLAETLQETPFLAAVTAAVRDGTALGGCSAGAVFMGVMAPYVADDAIRRWVRGVGILSQAYVMPHFDKLDSYAPGLRDTFFKARPSGAIAVGIDEETALVGDGVGWTVHGKGSVWIAEPRERKLRPFSAGDHVTTALGLTLP